MFGFMRIKYLQQLLQEFNFLLAVNNSRLARIEESQQELLRASREEKRRDEMAQKDIDRLKASVARNTEVVQSAVALVQGLAQQIRDAQDDPEELNRIADEMEANATQLADAVAANTPSAQPSPGEPASGESA